MSRLTDNQREVQAIVREKGLCGAVDDPPTVTCLRYANHRGCHGEYPGFIDPDDPDELGWVPTGGGSFLPR